MNYYIQGNKEKADQMRAAFEAKGCVMHTGIQCDLSDMIYYSLNGKVGSIKLRNLDLFKTHPDYKELELPVKPQFKLCDWIIYDKYFTIPIQIIDIKEKRGVYVCRNAEGIVSSYNIAETDKNYHFWSIADARDGDVITNGKLIVIFNKLEEPAYKQQIIAYVGLDLCGRLQITEDTWQLGVDKAMPATKEQRDQFFAKIKEAGYQWDDEKKELRKIKPHYNIANFKPYQKVLIRFGNNDTWRADFFSHIKEDRGRYFVGIGYANKQCIPFEGNEHLLGTTDMPSEEYINW